MKLLDEIQAHQEELISLRRDFHQFPELGFQEHRTATVVENYLRGLGLEPKRVAKTGVVALIQGAQSGPTLLLRADMDALPIHEEKEVDYVSKVPGTMHACGHDAHMAMLLVAAKILANHRENIKGNIKLVFQPNEEVAGAEVMIEEGVLDEPKVDAAVGLHVWPTIRSGKIGITEGTVMAGLDVFKVTIHGKGGHTGQPENAVDPILAAANLIMTSQMIQTREISNLQSTIIMFGKINGGTKSNIIPDQVTLEGSLRFLYQNGPDSCEQPTERFKRIVQQVCKTHRCTCTIDITHENKPLVNDSSLVSLARKTASKVFANKECVIDNTSIASEDFSAFSTHVPGVYMFLGTGDPEKESDIPLHNPLFSIDEDALTNGVAMYVYTALQYMDEH